MKLTSNDALLILEKQRGVLDQDSWIEHQICVGNTAGVIAKALNMDADKAKAMGYIHDIGKMFGYHGDGALTHAISGYVYLKELNYDEEYPGICILHSFLNNDVDCLAGDRSNRNNSSFSFINDYVKNHKYTDYDKLINLCDLMCTDKVMTMEKRLVDLLIRHGSFETTHYHVTEAVKLKEYFDNKLGFNLYNLFPAIKENL